MSEVLLFSGGMDSLIAWYYLEKPRALHCVIGQRYAKKELQAVDRVRRITGMEVEIENNLQLGVWEKPDADIPMRNMFLSMLASYHMDLNDGSLNRIWMIVQRGEMSIPDRSQPFLEHASELLSLMWEVDGDSKIVVDSPFREMTKVGMVRWYMENVGLLEPLLSTVGCFNEDRTGLNIHCGNCASCFRRAVAFEANGIPIYTWEEAQKRDLSHKRVQVYRANIRKWSGIQTYIDKMQAGEYEAERAGQTLEVLRKWGWEVALEGKF